MHCLLPFIFTGGWLADRILEGGSTKMKMVEDELLDVVYVKQHKF